MIIGRCANHTVKVGDRGPCQYRSKCAEGCPFGGYFSSNSATIPAAAKTGNMVLRPFSIVQEVIYDKESRKAKGVRVLDAETLQVHEYFAKVIFLCASTFGSTFILLNSTSEVFPNGLGNGSGQLGHNLMDMHFGAGAFGTIEGFEDKYIYGRRANGIYIPHFRNISEATKRKDYLRSFGYQGGADRGRPTWSDRIGIDLKNELTEPGNWTMGLMADGEHLPYYDNKVTLNRNKTDKYGLPILSIDCEFKENERAMRKDMVNSAAEMLEVAGAKNITTFDNDYKPGFYITESGTARMGHDPKTSVLNKWNQMHEVKNVFVTDASCMTSGCTTPGPSITYMALTARAVDYAVKELKKGNI
jgi:choline dehydrogenase-like flavoprotein